MFVSVLSTFSVMVGSTMMPYLLLAEEAQGSKICFKIWMAEQADPCRQGLGRWRIGGVIIVIGSDETCRLGSVDGYGPDRRRMSIHKVAIFQR